MLASFTIYILITIVQRYTSIVPVLSTVTVSLFTCD